MISLSADPVIKVLGEGEEKERRRRGGEGEQRGGRDGQARLSGHEAPGGCESACGFVREQRRRNKFPLKHSDHKDPPAEPDLLADTF